MWVDGQRHAPAVLHQGKRVVTDCTGGWLGPRDQSGRERKISPAPGFDPPDRPARGESLYRLSYRGPQARKAHESTQFCC